MSFLGGLGNFIGTAGPIAAQIGGDYEQAQAQGSGQRNQQAMQMLMLQRQQAKDAIENALNVSKTGEQNALTTVHQREAAKPQLGDAGYAAAMGDVAGAEALAKLSPELQLAVQKGQIDLNNATAIQNLTHHNKSQEINQEGGIRSGLQTNQQKFQATQEDLNRANAAAIAKANQQGHIQGIVTTQKGQIIPSIMNKIHGTSTPTPSTIPTAPLTLQQSQRAATDPDYKQFLISQGYSL